MFNKLRQCVFTMWVIVVSTSSFAQEPALSDEAVQALAQVQSMLTDPALFQDAAKQYPGGQQAAQELNRVAGGSPEREAAMRALASSLFESLVRESQGDPSVLMQKVLSLQQNPEAFVQSWTPEQRRMLKEIANSY